MTALELRERLASHAPGALVPVEWVLEQLGDIGPDFEGTTLCDIKQASKITGLSLKSLRDRGNRWVAQRNPEIRTTRSTPGKKGSPFLFAEEDCWEFARKLGHATPAPVPQEGSTERQAIVDHYVRKAVGD